jgi:uncharacterized protein YjeT (DUF2065 family)
MWKEIATAFSLVLVIEGILPFLSPNRWRSLAAVLADVDNSTLRMLGLVSMLVGTALLYVVH